MLQKNRFTIPNEEYDLIYDLVEKASGQVTYKSFLEYLRTLKRDYMRYRTILK